MLDERSLLLKVTTGNVAGQQGAMNSTGSELSNKLSGTDQGVRGTVRLVKA